MYHLKFGVSLTRRRLDAGPDAFGGAQGWGAKVVSFESASAARQWAEQSDPAVVKPDLLIVDYRLESGATGIEAIKSLRARFGAASAIQGGGRLLASRRTLDWVAPCDDRHGDHQALPCA